MTTNLYTKCRFKFALERAETAKRELNRVTQPNGIMLNEHDFGLVEDAWRDAEADLRAELEAMGVPVDRTVGVLS